MSRLRRANPGQTLVEFALVLTVFLLMTMGIVDLGRGILTYNMISNAAREGARVGIYRTNQMSDMCARAIAAVPAAGVTSATCSNSGSSSSVTAGTLKVQVQRGTAGDATAPDQVTLTYAFSPITPIIGTTPITLTAESSMYVEN